MALERNPAVCHALRETPEWEVAPARIPLDRIDVDPERREKLLAPLRFKIIAR
jgi:hypothetical protein